MTFLDSEYWNKRYLAADFPWDLGQISPPLQKYIDTIEDKDITILIPGAGKAHEALYLLEKGFNKVYVCDWAASSFDDFRAKNPNHPTEYQLVSDYFDLDLKVDLILEQTFFCAINPTLRKDYAVKSASLLNTNGKVAGLLFGSAFPFDGPPFGGKKEEYLTYFEPYFDVLQMEISPDSAKPRLGNELFFELIKR